MIKTALFASLLLFVSAMIAQEIPSSESESVIIPDLEGILLLGDWNLVRTEPIDSMHGVNSIGIGLLDNNKSFLVDLYSRFIGKPLTQNSMQAIKQTISNYYESKNQPLVVVSTPRQELTKKILQLVVSEAKLGEIRFKGNKYFSSKQLEKYVRAEKGQPIAAKKLYEDLAFMNHNPFRRTDAVFTPGEKPGIADLELLTVDRWPYRVYAGADNTGTISTERNRIFFGVNLGKTIVQDSEVSYQYSQAPNGNRFFSHTGYVRVPLPWFRQIIQAYGGYASAKPDSGVSHLRPRGTSWQVDLRYRFPFYEDLEILQEFVLGYDYKESNTNLLFNSMSDYYGMASMNQFMLGYNVGVRNRNRKIFLNVEIFGNPSGITNHNNRRSYETLRYGAEAAYAYVRAAHSLSQEFYGWWFSYDLSGQYSTTNLLPSEQFTMTGYNSVRGFEERILNLDNAAILHLTLETPHVSPAYWFGWCKHYDELYVLAFIDTGFGGNHQRSKGESSLSSLGSVGPSLRYQYSRYFSTHLDYGFQLWHSGFDPITSSRYNFGVILSY
jgi:hemolysin activation/secretion protein